MTEQKQCSMCGNTGKWESGGDCPYCSEQKQNLEAEMQLTPECPECGSESIYFPHDDKHIMVCYSCDNEFKKALVPVNNIYKNDRAAEQIFVIIKQQKKVFNELMEKYRVIDAELDKKDEQLEAAQKELAGERGKDE